MQDLIVERGRFVMLVHRIDRGDEDRRFSQVMRLDEPQRNGTGPNQVPVRIREQCACQRGMMMRVLENNVRAAGHHVADDSFIEWMVPDCAGRDDHAVLTDRFREFLEMFLLVRDDFGARLFERRRVEQAVAAQVFVVVADQELELCSAVLGEPCGPPHCRLVFDSRIND